MRAYLHTFVLLSAIGFINLAAADPIENDFLGTVPTTQPTTDIDILTEQLKQLRGNVEELQYEIATLKEKFAKFSADTEMRFNDNAKASKSSTSSELALPSDNSANTNTDDLYQKGYALLKEKKYEQATETLKAFIKQNPTHKQVGSAYFWLGEIKAMNKKHEQAVVEYMHGYKANPKGARAPDNLLKLGTNLGKIGKKREACIALQKLKTEFPTPSATIAKNLEAQLKQLACE